MRIKQKYKSEISYLKYLDSVMFWIDYVWFNISINIWLFNTFVSVNIYTKEK